ncbi:MAG: nucleotidyltransferase domain-containing protein, partial [Gammaproteobacteria bacterium]
MWPPNIADPLLFDDEAFSKALQDNKAPLQLFKQTLEHGHQTINDFFEAGISVKDLVHKRAWFVDQLLLKAWQSNIRSDGITLAAVGGYGRGELHPCSDIDLMILQKPRIGQQTKQQIEKFLVFLWDIGLEVGHSVRTVKNCIQEARNDITIATNIMESRLLAGNSDLYQKMRKSTGPNKIWRTKKFFEAKWQEQIERHHKYDDTGHKLEPNIKEGPGGLRDIQVIGWVAKRHFGADTLHELVNHGFLTEEEYQILDTGQIFLWRIRFALHMLNNRREDRLLFDYQRDLAQLFGFHASDNSGVEQF